MPRQSTPRKSARSTPTAAMISPAEAGTPSAVIDRQTLLASMPKEWEEKFNQELTRSPLVKLVAIQVCQHLVEAYRQSLELALQAGEVDLRKAQSPYLKITAPKTRPPAEKPPSRSKKATSNPFSVRLTRAAKALTKPQASTEQQIEQSLTALNFWESSASYMWFDLTKLAFREMETDLGEQLKTMAKGDRLDALYRYIFGEASALLKSNFSTILQIYIDQAVQLILNKYDLPSKTLQELEWLAGFGKRNLPSAPATSPNLFHQSNTSSFATCKLLWESVNILTQKTDLQWQPDDEGKLAYTSDLRDDRGKLIFWVTDNPEEQYPEALAGEAALAVIETFDIRAACMHLIYAAHVTGLERPWEEEFVIDDQQISAYLGLDKRKDLKKDKRLKLIERISEQPAQILTFLHWSGQQPPQPHPSPRHKGESFYVEKSRLWEVAIGYHGQRDLFGDIKCTGLTIRCRAGLWAKYFLNKRGSEASNAFYQYGVLSKTLLQTITKVWQHSEGAARMLAWLSFRTHISTQPEIATITLMEVAYGAEKLNEAQGDRSLRNEIAKAWDNDLRILNEAGLRIKFDPATYPTDLQPEWKTKPRTAPKRPKGYWDRLCQSRLEIYPPPEIIEGIAQLQRRRRSDAGNDVPDSIELPGQPSLPPDILSEERSSLFPANLGIPDTDNLTGKPRILSYRAPMPPLTGAEIKSARELKGWHQADLGQRLGRTKMWISLIERDLRSINPKDEQNLRQVLDL